MQLDQVLSGVGIEVKEPFGQGSVTAEDLKTRLEAYATTYYGLELPGYKLPLGVITCSKTWKGWRKAEVKLPSADELSASATAREKRRNDMSSASGGTGGYGAGRLSRPTSYPPRNWQPPNPALRAGPCPAWAGPAAIIAAILYVVGSMVLLYLFMGPREP
jgi:hypothetical protein